MRPVLLAREHRASIVVENVDLAGVGRESYVLARYADDEVRSSPAIDVAGGQRGAEAVAGLRCFTGADRVLAESAAAGPGKPARRSEHYPDRTGVDDVEDILIGCRDREVVESIRIEVCAGQCEPEMIVGFRAVGEAR